MEATPRAATSLADCTALAAHWITHFSISDITSDLGAQFTSPLWGELCQQQGMRQQNNGLPPKANGMVKRLHCHLMDALQARCTGTDWIDHLSGSFWACSLRSARTANRRLHRPSMRRPHAAWPTHLPAGVGPDTLLEIFSREMVMLYIHQPATTSPGTSFCQLDFRLTWRRPPTSW